MEKNFLYATAIISILVYLIIVVTIIYFFGWFPAIFFGLITGFLSFKAYYIYENLNASKNIIERMNKRKEEGVIIGGKKFNLNKGVLHGDEIPGEDPKPKSNLGDLNQLVKKKVTKGNPKLPKKPTKKKTKTKAKKK